MKKLIEFEARANHREVLRALLDNRTLKTYQGYSVFYDCAERNPFRINKGGADEGYIFHDHGITHEEIEEEWYENIPEQGILCWVWNDDESLRAPYFVYSYHSHCPLRFKCCSETSIKRDPVDYIFKNAAPMTASEVQKHIFSE